jgi:alkanesulfonate monooxygenase SsuD/methylene tetrahydromethanopterin reductase-like flavin-dependent oxidoreductase (luciferase family)
VRVALVSCVKSKRSEPSAARDLYVSALFQKSRAWAERHCDGWYVLSAEHGLLSPDQRVAPYEKTLDRARRKERRALAENVHRQLGDLGLLGPGISFVWLAGTN